MRVVICSTMFLAQAMAFTVHQHKNHPSSAWGVGVHSRSTTTTPLLWASSSPSATEATASSFIDTQLRGAAMKLHTRKQAPKEGQVEEKEPPKPYVPTQADYLQYLVDNQHVYVELEAIVKEEENGLAMYQDTGLERVDRLEQDIEFMMSEFNLERPAVGSYGAEYAKELRAAVSRSIPEFMCHYYNFYFAHTAGGRMIGKQMSALLLEKKTLEFYKWDDDLNKIKAAVKEDIEEMAAKWSQEEKDECVGATAAAFRFGGGINGYLNGKANKA